MRQLACFIFINLYIVTVVFSQHEANNWYFGSNAGLNFNFNPALGVSGSLNTQEGCSSISDRNGNLLFYTDGLTVWNKNHVPMQNGTGLLGFPSSTQSALIIRKPGSNTIYYIFTADGTSYALNHHLENGYRYSIVDMALYGGLGAVISVKNVLLYAPSTEKLSAVKQADGVNIWLMTHEWNSSRFRAYSITCNGIDTNAVKSDIGLVLQTYYGSDHDAIGQMKFSPDGKRLAIVINGQSKVQVYNFNNATGSLSNPINILAYWPDTFLQPDGTPFDFEWIYGLEFSPNGKLLYLSCINTGNFYQYDLSPGNSTGISATGLRFQPGPWCTTNPNGWSCLGSDGGIQLGPDGKIYMAYKPNKGLDVVASPDVYGWGCDYVRSPVLTNSSNYGLPSFMASYFDQNAIKVDQHTCTVNLSSNFAAASYYWTFGDPAAPDQFSTAPNPSVEYSTIGKYKITLAITNSSGCSDTLEKIVNIEHCKDLSFPNVFSPNGDGVNDAFFIQGIDDYPDNEVLIFNRWGNEIFHQKGYSSSSLFYGNSLSEGVYYYTVIINSINLNYKGFVTIIKGSSLKPVEQNLLDHIKFTGRG